MFEQTYAGGYQQPIYTPQPEMMMRQQYQPMQAQPQYQPQRPPQTGMVWVQGEAGAKSYLIAAGNTVPLWDSENQTIYVKTVDASGVPSMRILDYKERAQAASAGAQAFKNPGDEYVTRKEFEELAAKITALTVKPVRKTVKEGENNG